MRTIPKKALFITLAAGAACIGGGVAIANSDSEGIGKPNPAPTARAEAQPLSATVADHFKVFRDQESLPAANAKSQVTLPAESTLAAVARSIAEAPSEKQLHHLDLARAVQVPVEGGSDPAWIAPTRDGVCSIITDPVDGAGVGCATVEQIQGGLGLTVLGPDKSGKFVILSAVPDGGDAPVIVSGNNSRPLSVTANAAAAVISDGGQVSVGRGPALDLDRLIKAQQSK